MRFTGEHEVARLQSQEFADVRDQAINRTHQIGKAGATAEFAIDRNSNLARFAIKNLETNDAEAIAATLPNRGAIIRRVRNADIVDRDVSGNPIQATDHNADGARDLQCTRILGQSNRRAAGVPSVTRPQIKDGSHRRLLIRIAVQLLAQGFELAAKVESNTINRASAIVQMPVSSNPCPGDVEALFFHRSTL